MDRKMVVYGLTSNEGDPPTFTMTALSVSSAGLIGSNLYLQGSPIFSLNPFDAQFDVEDGILDMVPVVNFAYLKGPFDGALDSDIFARSQYCYSGSIDNPTASQMVAELSSWMFVDTPAANTAASIRVDPDTAQDFVRIKGFGFTVTAVAAIAAPILVELREDPDGANALLWSGQVLVPAGTSKEVWIPANIAADLGAVLTVGDPGATNFVTAIIEANNRVGLPPS